MGDAPGVVGQTPLTEGDIEAPSTEFSQRMEHEQHALSLKLRKTYGVWVLIIAAAQIAAINGFFLLYGIGYIPFCRTPFHPPEDLFKYFIVSVFAEVLALAYIVTRNLFPGEGGFWSNLLGLFKKDP